MLQLFLMQQRTHDVQYHLGFKREGWGKETHLSVAAQKPPILLLQKILSSVYKLFYLLSLFTQVLLGTYIFRYLAMHS